MKRALLFLPGREAWLVVAGTCLIAATYGLVRLAYGLFLPDISTAVDVGTTTAGYISSGASVAYCLGAWCGLVLDERPRVLVVSAVATAAGGSVAMALAPTLAVLAPSAIVASAGAGLASPGLVGIVAGSVHPSRASAAQATVNAGTGPGLVAAGALALTVPDWRTAFLLSAVVTVLAGAAVLALGRRSARAEAADAGPGDTRSLLTAVAVPALAAILLGAASAATWTYGRTQVAATGASEATTVMAWTALGVGGTVAVLSAPTLAKLRPHVAWRWSVAVVALATAVLAATSAPLALHVFACAAFGWGFVAASSALIAWAGRLVPERQAAATSALFVSLVLGQAGGSALSGDLASRWGMSSAFLVAAVVGLLAAACGRQSVRPTPPAPHPRVGGAVG